MTNKLDMEERWNVNLSEICAELSSVITKLTKLQEEVCYRSVHANGSSFSMDCGVSGQATSWPVLETLLESVSDEGGAWQEEASVSSPMSVLPVKRKGKVRMKKKARMASVASGCLPLVEEPCAHRSSTKSKALNPAALVTELGEWASEAIEAPPILAAESGSVCQTSNASIIQTGISGPTMSLAAAREESTLVDSVAEEKLPEDGATHISPSVPHDCTQSQTSLLSSKSFFNISAKDLTPSAILRACQNQSEENIRRVLQCSVDPNMTFNNVDHKGMKLTFCTPLVIAALRGQTILVKWLVDFGADVNSEYGFIAGARRFEWIGACANVPVAAGNQQMLEMLINCKADVMLTANNGATLLWQASYFNQASMCKYLLEKHSDVEQRVTSPDDENLSYTPLHSAAKAGYHTVVAALLEAKACTHVGDCMPEVDLHFNSVAASPGAQSTHSSATVVLGRCPLQDAIEHGHAKAVRLLVEHGADLFRATPEGCRCLDVAFQSRNAVLVSSVAEGLKKAPRLLDEITRTDLIAFLQFDGEIPCFMLQAVFQPHEIRYWDEKAGRKIRTLLNVAFMEPGRTMLVRSGPHADVLRELFVGKEVPSDRILKFLEDVAPQHREHAKGHSETIFGPVHFLMCHIPAVHEHLDVLLALANTSNDSVFKEPGCQAILHHAAHKVRHSSKIQVVIAGIEVLNLVSINVVLNLRIGGDLWLKQTTMLALLVSAMDVFLYFQQALGYWWQGLLPRFRSQWFNGVVLAATGGMISWLYDTGFRAKESAVYSSTLGILVFIKWMQLLFSLCQFRFVGFSILPITSAMLDIGPFCVVMAVCILASGNLYYALGIHGPFESFLKIYQMIVLADFNLHDLEDTATVQSSNMHARSDGYFFQDPTEKTDYYYVVRGMLILLSFVFGVSLMNLFIAVLTVSYSQATKKALVFFSQQQAHKVIETQAIHIGWQVTKRFFSPCLQKKDRALEFVSASEPMNMGARHTSSSSRGSADTGLEPVRRLSNFGLHLRPLRHQQTASMVRNLHRFMWVCLPSLASNSGN